MQQNETPFTATTNEIRVSVLPIYLPNKSNPSNNVYVWAYQVRIENRGNQEWQLISRYWKITDAMGRIQEVRGKGVVGEQPKLPPGTKFDYTSSVTLSLPSGVMVGSYTMQNLTGGNIEIGVPLFSLDSATLQKTIH